MHVAAGDTYLGPGTAEHFRETLRAPPTTGPVAHGVRRELTGAL